ncbi:MAG: hypothetical protein GX652_14510 [Burkholderiaceae bacterium]|nr:hypothetical protein [Burkholderiaceae bacterium]
MIENHRNGSERPERDKAPPPPNPPDDQPNPSGMPAPRGAAPGEARQ